MESKQVAQEILNQLGGNKLIAMTGARNFVSSDNSLWFKIPSRTARNGINYIQIKLNVMDLYDVTFSKVRNMEIKEVSNYKNIYNDGLKKLFVAETGLNLSL